MRVLVTGGSGLAGRHIVPQLLDAGHSVVSADLHPPQGGMPRFDSLPSALRYVTIDATDFGMVVAAAKGMEAIIHMAAIPNPVWAPEHEVFRLNMTANWNVLEAAEIHGIEKVVMASSINAIGASFSALQPREYFPLDEESPPKVADAYAQSKWMGEVMAEAFCRRRTMQISSMRFHGLWTRERQAQWNAGEDKGSPDDERHAKNFWSWVDIDDAAHASVLSIEKDWTGHEAFFIQAADTLSETPTEELLHRWYPGAERKAQIRGVDSPISHEKAARILGWRPEATWRDA